MANRVASAGRFPNSRLPPNQSAAISATTNSRATLSASYEADFGGFLGDGWLLGADLVYGEAHRALTYVDLRSVAIAGSTAPDGRQRYNAFGGTATTNQDLLLTNDNRGRSILAVARVAKEWDNGLSADLSYTWQDIEDVNAKDPEEGQPTGCRGSCRGGGAALGSAAPPRRRDGRTPWRPTTSPPESRARGW